MADSSARRALTLAAVHGIVIGLGGAGLACQESKAVTAPMITVPNGSAPTRPEARSPSGLPIAVAQPDPTLKDCCKGRNECKGLSGCESAKNTCKGKNACKGDGTACDASDEPALAPKPKRR